MYIIHNKFQMATCSLDVDLVPHLNLALIIFKEPQEILEKMFFSNLVVRIYLWSIFKQ